jgi:hypothetical protein
MTRLPERYRDVMRGMVAGAPLAIPAAGKRPVYGALALRARQLAGEDVGPVEVGALPGVLPAASGAELGALLWNAVAGGVREVVWRFVELQRADGSFLVSTAADNLESLWYHELIVLHGVASFGLRHRDEHALGAARRAAVYHLNETQPDHATTEPWGINAFLLEEGTYSLAEQQLHALQTQWVGGADGVSAVLLRDTLVGYGVGHG